MPKFDGISVEEKIRLIEENSSRAPWLQSDIPDGWEEEIEEWENREVDHD